MSHSLTAVDIICCYAHEDELYREQLETHLGALQRQGLISLWHDQQILPGANWAETIDKHLETASIIILLISADFIASDYCYSIEMKRALERHEANEARVIPILVRPCDWETLRIGSLQALPPKGKPISTWADNDEAWRLVTTDLRLIIADLSQLSANAPRTALPPIWMIPSSRNPFFLGREKVLSQLHTQLQTGQTMALSQPQAVSGLGGIGKTQIAIEYAYRYSQRYQVVLWAPAESIEVLNTSYSQLATKLNLPEKEEKKQEIIIEAMKRWLQNHSNWLLILDNAEDLTLLKDFLPPVMGGHLLITTRASAMGQIARRIEVNTFTEEQGALFLLRRSAMIAPDAHLTEARKHDQILARAISCELGGLPLALDQAGAYLEQTGYSLADYQKIYQQHRAFLLRERGGLVADHPDPVATTWSLSFTRVEQKSALAVQILRLCTYLSADSIPLEVMTEGTEPIEEDLFVLGQAIKILREYSLVNHDSANRTLSLHRLVQVVMHDSLPSEEQMTWIQRAVRRIENNFPNDAEDVSQWKTYERWLPHVLTCATWIEQAHIGLREAGDLLHQTAYYLHQRAQYAEAKLLYQRALRVREQQWGSDHSQVAFSLNGLAIVYYLQGKYAEAEALFLRALRIWEQQLGPDHLQVAILLNNLGELYREQGEYTKAEPLYLRALQIRKQQLGSDHPNMAYPLQNLAILYFYQGKYVEAEALYLRALRLLEQRLGPDHHVVAHPLNNLGELYRELDKYAEAEALYLRALRIWEQQLGPEHPQITYPLDGLGELYRKQGKYVEAEALFFRALQIREQQWGSDHPRTQLVRSKYVSLLRDMGKDEEAKIRERQSGPEHPELASSLNGLGELYQEQGEYAKAEPLFLHALQIWEQQLGPEHPRTQLVRSKYISLLRDMGRDEEAKKMEKLCP